MSHFDHSRTSIMRQHAQQESPQMNDEDLARERERTANSQARLQRKLEASSQRLKDIQAKREMEISQPEDAQEKEADEVAEKVTNGEGKEVTSLTPPPSGNNIHRKEEEALMAKGEDGKLNATGSLHSQLESSKGGGQVLDDKTKDEMESKMNADLSGVRIHTGDKAHSMAEGINAKAFTHGQDIYFKNGNYDPGSKEGKSLLAHELVHTQQQKGDVERKVQKKDLDNIPQATRPGVNVVTTILPHAGAPLKDLFKYGVTYSASDPALKSVADNNVTYTNVPEKLKGGFKNMVNNLINEKEESGKKISKLPPDSSVTLFIDFTSDTPDVNSYPDADKPGVQAEFATKKAYRFTRYTAPADKVKKTPARTEIQVQGLGAISKADAVEGKKTFDANFRFNNSPKPRSKQPNIGLKGFTPEERQKVYQAVSNLSSGMVSTLKGCTFERAAIAQADYENKIKAKKGDTFSPAIGADYSFESNTITIYDFGLSPGAPSLFETNETGFTAGLEQTLQQAAGEKMLRSKEINFSFNDDPGPRADQPGVEMIPFTPEDKRQFYGAMAKLPESILKTLSGMKIERAKVSFKDLEAQRVAREKKQKEPDISIAADYTSETHTMTIYNYAFEKSLTIFGEASGSFSTSFEQTIIHEVGHAVDKTPIRLAEVPYREAQNNYSAKYKQYSAAYDAMDEAMKAYNKKVDEINDLKQKNAPQDQLDKANQDLQTLDADYNTKKAASDKLDQEVKELKAAMTAQKEVLQSATSDSGAQKYINNNTWDYKDNEKVGQSTAGTNAFRTAALKDKGDAITDYAQTKWSEYYAEAFSLYITDKERLKVLEPNLFTYFEQKFAKK